ncbi:hypothetical protein SAMN04487904_102414 [Actinopolyspora lacussalsi subsp. righensis]|uniref:MYXO-CTERM domain-containing protein n=1 Tax=Actinopolyspora righensis TaxID=995060 RepID=A0A1I6YCT3_9ACTN|nr:hypothetical protein [Actinopolyspora righensis]SFT48190.1 hypothetical protein SAMN04487904_102414 [Actinopolyspora righensis]
MTEATRRRSAPVRLFCSLLFCFAILLAGQSGVAVAVESQVRPVVAESATSESPSRAARGVASREDGHTLAQSEGNSPSDDSEGEQDRRTVIGALGVVLVVGVLLLRRKRGKQSLMVRWRKRS